MCKFSWIGQGKVFESELKLDQFCKKHEFADHFEITSHDWVSREKSVFGQAVNCLLDEIFEANERKNKTISKAFNRIQRKQNGISLESMSLINTCDCDELKFF